jgi:iron complex transport system ATP-binding protein
MSAGAAVGKIALELRNVGSRLHGRAVIETVSLSVRRGEMLALIGPNGAGKTTLLKSIAQLQPYSGDILLHGSDARALRPQQRAQRIAYLSQDHDWSWPITVANLVALGRYPHRQRWRGARAQDDAAVRAALQKTDLLALAERPLNRLSGGERARAMLARALAVDADILLADEPVASLDPYHQLRVIALLREHCREGRTVIAVLHDLTLASRFCDRLALLDRGRLVALGDVNSVLTPDHLRRVYGVSAMQGEYEQQCYVLPWQYHSARPSADTNEEDPDRDHDAVRL